MTSWGKNMRSALGWSVIGYGASRVSALLTTIVVTRILLPSQFGIVAAVFVFLTLIELGSDLGMNATVVYEQRHDQHRLNVAFTLNLLFALALAAIGWLLAPAIAALFGFSHQVAVFRLAPISLVFSAFGNIHDGLLLRDMDFRQRIRPSIVRSFVRSIVSIALALAGFGASSLVLGYIAGSAMWSAALWRITGFRPRLSLERGAVRGMASYGGAAAMLEVLAVVGARLDQVVVGRVLGQRALGLYSVGHRVPETTVDTVSWTVSMVAFPGLAPRREQDPKALGSAALQVLRYQALYALPVTAVLAVLATPMCVVLFGANWRSAGAVMSAVSVMAGVGALVAPMGDVFKALGRQRTLVAVGLIQAPFYVALVVWAGPHGIATVAWARAGGQALATAVILFLTMRAAEVTAGHMARELRPALIAATAVAVTAAAVHAAWPADKLLPLCVAVAAALGAGVLALRLLAPATFRELLALRPRSSAPVAG